MDLWSLIPPEDAPLNLCQSTLEDTREIQSPNLLHSGGDSADPNLNLNQNQTPNPNQTPNLKRETFDDKP